MMEAKEKRREREEGRRQDGERVDQEKGLKRRKSKWEREEGRGG